MKIYYENSQKEIFNMHEFPVVIDDVTPIFKKKWKYDTTGNKVRNRSTIDQIYKTAESITLTLSIFADSPEEYEECMERFERITERDIYSETPGKLWVNGYYLECFILSETPKEYEELFCAVENDIEIVAPYHFWISMKEEEFNIVETTSTNNKTYQGRYPYRYANNTRSRYIINENQLESNFKLIEYGPTVNPSVKIGEHVYLVYIILEEGERLEIDTRLETIKKIKRNGDEVNAFHNRQQKKIFFRRIKTGRLEIMWTGNFKFDLIIYDERSVPKWRAGDMEI